MKRFSVYTSPDSYEKHGGEIGDIYVQLDDYAFPGRGWTDFGFNIVFWWMEAFMKLLTGETDNVQCKFMDGNYRFDVTAISSGVWRMQFIAERETDEVWQEGDVDAHQAAEALLESGKVLIGLLQQKGDNRGVSNLTNFSQQFQTVLSSTLIR